MVKRQKTGVKVKVNWSKNMYYTKGSSIIEMNRHSRKKKVVGKFKRNPDNKYFVTKDGNLYTSANTILRKHRRSR